MKLSILMPCLSSRPWRRLRDALHAQASRFGDEAQVLTLEDGGEATSGVKRQQLADTAEGEYLAFVDDDDEVAGDYVASLLAGCATGADVVTFDMRFVNLSIHPRYRMRKSERWRLGMYDVNRGLGLMSANHLCAWRASVARKVAWCPHLGYGEDQLWYQALIHGTDGLTEYHIDKVLYHYLFDPIGTVNQTRRARDCSAAYFGRGLRCFKDDSGGILVEVGPPSDDADLVEVRDSRNSVSTRAVNELTLYRTVILS